MTKRQTSTPRAGKKKAEGEKRPIGRPSLYSEEIAAVICADIMEGQSLRSICKRDEMPDQKTVFNWLHRHDEFFQQYARAREVQADYLFEECLEIADDATNDYMEKQNKDGSTYMAVDHDHINRSRLRVDTRKWMAGKLAPKKYGEKVTQEISGIDGAPLSPTIVLTGRPEPAPASEAVAGIRERRH